MIKEFTPIITGTVVNAILMGLTVWVIKSMVTTLLNDFKKTIKETMTGFQRAIDKLECEDKELWDAVNHHGHKGLSVEDAVVTRG